MSRKKVHALSVILSVSFVMMLFTGAALMLWPSPTGSHGIRQPSAQHDNVTSEISQALQSNRNVDAIPRALLISGGLGVVLLLVRVRVQWRTRKLSVSGRELARGMTFITGAPITVLSPVESLPLLVWWIVRKKAPVIRVHKDEIEGVE